MAGAVIKSIEKWTEAQLWAVFLLVDGLHDYGDIGGTRSVAGAYDWYIAQEIPAVLYDTFTPPPADAVNVKNYTERLFGIDLKPATRVEPLLTHLLQRGLPARMGLATTPPPGMGLADFALVPSGIYYELPLSRLVAIATAAGAAPEDDVLTRLIDVCKSLRRIRLNKEGFSEDVTPAIMAAAAPGLQRFFGELVSATDLSLVSNFDASPGFYKYLYGFTQRFTPLNFLDSVGASETLSATGVLATYTPVTDLAYNTQFMSLRRRGEMGEGPLFSVSISSGIEPPHATTISVSYNGAVIATDTIEGTFGAKSYASGPTLGYIANLIALIQEDSRPVIPDAALQVVIDSAHSGKNIYKLDKLIKGVNAEVKGDKTLLCRFLSDWKGYGDAEQVRVMAEGLARDPDPSAAALDVDAPRPLPTKSFLGGTVDENSHQQMTLRNITNGYSHYKFYDFTIFPTLAPTAGDLMYNRITDLVARATGIINIAHKMSSLSALSSELLAGLVAGYTAVNGRPALALLNVNRRDADLEPILERFLAILIKYKFCNAHQFVADARAVDATGLSAVVGTFQTPATAFNALRRLPDVSDFTVTLDSGEKSVTQFANDFEAAMNSQQPNANLCKAVLTNLAPPRIDADVALPYIQTTLTGISGTETIFKQNTTIGFEPKHLSTIASSLVAIVTKFTYTDIEVSSMQKITQGLYGFLSSFYVPDGASFDKDMIDNLVYEFKRPIRDACEAARTSLKAAERGARADITNKAKADIIAAMFESMKTLLKKLDETLQLEGCEGRMIPSTGGQRGGADPMFKGSVNALFTLASSLSLSIIGANWSWPDLRIVTFSGGEIVLDDNNVRDNDGGLATNEEEEDIGKLFEDSAVVVENEDTERLRRTNAFQERVRLAQAKANEAWAKADDARARAGQAAWEAQRAAALATSGDGEAMDVDVAAGVKFPPGFSGVVKALPEPSFRERVEQAAAQGRETERKRAEQQALLYQRELAARAAAPPPGRPFGLVPVGEGTGAAMDVSYPAARRGLYVPVQAAAPRTPQQRVKQEVEVGRDSAMAVSYSAPQSPIYAPVQAPPVSKPGFRFGPLPTAPATIPAQFLRGEPYRVRLEAWQEAEQAAARAAAAPPPIDDGFGTVEVIPETFMRGEPYRVRLEAWQEAKGAEARGEEKFRRQMEWEARVEAELAQAVTEWRDRKTAAVTRGQAALEMMSEGNAVRYIEPLTTAEKAAESAVVEAATAIANAAAAPPMAVSGIPADVVALRRAKWEAARAAQANAASKVQTLENVVENAETTVEWEKRMMEGVRERQPGFAGLPGAPVAPTSGQIRLGVPVRRGGASDLQTRRSLYTKHAGGSDPAPRRGLYAGLQQRAGPRTTRRIRQRTGESHSRRQRKHLDRI
jgi:hypothetical protein